MKFLLKVYMLPALLLLAFSCNTDPEPHPNFVILQLDDLGFDDLGIHGNRLVETPHIDSFAARSIQFEHFYVNPVCAPTRASLLTGRHFMRTGVSHVHGGKDFLNLDERTFADYLKEAGYATGMWGKWHSGHTPGYFPWERGFEEAYMAQLYKHRESRGSLNGDEVEHAEWADEVIADYAVDFMDRHRDEPFLAYLSFLSIHAPLQTPDSLKQKYVAKGLSPKLSTLYGMAEHVDHYIGEVIYALDTMDLLRNTVIFFMSDNGPAVLNADLTERDREIRYVSDFKGHKGNIWENGVKSPLFVHWEGITRPVLNHNLVDVTDLLPTLLELAGIEYSGEKVLDGKSFADIIIQGHAEERPKVSYNYSNRGWPPTDQPWTPKGVLDEYRPVTPETKPLEVYDDQIISVRKGGFKLLHKPGKTKDTVTPENDYVLINILEDPREEVNLYSELPDIASDLESLLKEWWAGILSESGSFRMPSFKIGAEGARETVIPAKGPARVSEGVVSAFAWLTHWIQPGDFAEYHIEVATPGLYEVTLEYSGHPTNALVRVGTEKDKTANRVVLFDRAILGSIALAKEDTLLRVELLENPAGRDVFPRLENIRFIRK